MGADTVASLTGVSASTTQKNAGTYSVVAGGSDNNYNLSFVPGSLIMNKAPLTVTGNSLSTTYNGAAQSLSGFTASGLLGTDTVNSLTGTTASGVVAKNAGSYVNAVTSTSELNYNVTTVDGALTIAKANAVVTANSATTTYNGGDQTVNGFTVSGLVGSDTAAMLSGVTASLTRRNAGNYATTASGSDGNYNLSFVPGNLVINKAALTVRANDDARFVGQSDTVGYAGVSYSGWVGNESASVLTGNAIVTRSASGPDGNSAGANTLLGTYSGVLSASGLSSNNYTLNYVPGNYTVVPTDQLLVKVQPASSAYGNAATYTLNSAQYLNSGNNAVVNLSVTGLGNNRFQATDGVGGSAIFTVSPTSPSLSGAGQLKAGSYPLGVSDVSVTAGSNFSNVLTLVGVQTVNAVPVTAVPVVSKVYDGTTTIASLAVPLNGVLTNDTVSATGAGNFSGKNAGTGLNYTLSGLSLSGADASNYYLSSGSGVSASNGVITRAPLSVNFTAVDKVYDGNTMASLTYVDNRFNGDVFGVLSTGTFSDKNVGTAKSVSVTGVSLTGADSGNYSVSVTGNTTSASITRLPQVTWVGGTTGNWFDSANWAGGAVPDLANVATVSIPAGVTSSFGSTVVSPAQAGPVSLDALGTAGSLMMSGGSLTVGAGGVNLASLTQSGGNLTSSGLVSLDSLNQSAGSLVANALSTTTAYSQTGTGTVSVTGSANISATTGPVILGKLTVGADLAVNSMGGAISQTTGIQLAVSGDTALAASNNGLPADVLLGNTGNTLAGNVTTTGRDVVLKVSGALSANVTAKGNATLTAGGAMTADVGATGNVSLTAGEALVADVVAAGNVSLSSAGNLIASVTAHDLTASSGGATMLGTNRLSGSLDVTSMGDVTQTQPVNVEGASSIKSISGDVMLNNAANTFVGLITAQGQDVSLSSTTPMVADVIASGDVTLRSSSNVTASTSAHSLTITSGGAAVLGNTVLSGQLSLTTQGGSITQTAPVQVAGASQFNAGTGQVMLTNVNNSFVGAVTVVAGTSSILGNGVAQPNESLATQLVLTPRLSGVQAPYTITVVKELGSGQGIVHLALKQMLNQSAIVLPEQIQEWLKAATGDIQILDVQGEPLANVQLVDGESGLVLQAVSGQRLPPEIGLITSQGNLLLRVVQAQ